MSSDVDAIFQRLGLALAIGLLVGLERGWKAREAAEGERVAGLRTYALSGLLGGGAVRRPSAICAKRSPGRPVGSHCISSQSDLSSDRVCSLRSDDCTLPLPS